MKPMFSAGMSKEGQCMKGQIPWVKYESSTDTKVNQTYEQVPVVLHRLVYACQFPVKPQALNYYYVPEANELQSGQPVLQGSPLFEGPLGTKWQVTTTFIRWIGVTRWVSLYLTRRDKIETQMNIQCEFRIVDQKRNVLRSMRSKFTSMVEIDGTRGFSKFMPFKEMKKMITDDSCLRVEAHIIFLNKLHLESDNPNLLQYNTPLVSVTHPKVEMFKKHQKMENTTEEEDNVPILTRPPFIPSSVFYIEEDDQVAIWYNEVFLAHTSRKLLLEMSNVYHNSVDKWWNRIDIYAGEGESPSEPVVQQCLQYLHQRNCEYLQSGSYDDIFELFNFAETMKMDSLLLDCVNELFVKVDCENAALLIAFMERYFGCASKKNLEHFRSFYRKNIRIIKKTDGFKSLLMAEDESVKDLLVRIAWDPDFSFDSTCSSSSGDSDYDKSTDDGFSNDVDDEIFDN